MRKDKIDLLECSDLVEGEEGQIKIGLKLNTYKVITDAVEKGARYGVYRAYKHDDNPDKESIIQHVEDAVMNELSEVVLWDTDYED